MRIALTNPWCWPQVRRGSERLLHELSHYLADRGHEVTAIASAPGPARREREGKVARRLLPQWAPFPIANRWLNPLHRFGWQVYRELRRGEFDAVFALNYHDAFGALAARATGARFRLTYLMAGIADARYFRTIPHDGLMYRTVLRRAEAVISVSAAAQRTMLREFGQESVLLASPTDTDRFAAAAKPAPDGALRILFVGDADEPRKGAVVLARAFARLWRSDRSARLDYSGRAGEAVMAAVRAAVPPEAVPSVTFHGVGAVDDLPRLYAAASVFVNPAVWEAQGMVLVEALAAGTPVVGCAHGGIPDVVDDPAVGRLFAPGPLAGRAASDDAALADAITEAAALARDPATAARCRAHAERFGWRRLGPQYEALITGQSIAACMAAEPCRMDAAWSEAAISPSANARAAARSA